MNNRWGACLNFKLDNTTDGVDNVDEKDILVDIDVWDDEPTIPWRKAMVDVDIDFQPCKFPDQTHDHAACHKDGCECIGAAAMCLREPERMAISMTDGWF